MYLSKNQLIRLFMTISIIKIELISAKCDVCQSSNSVACHSETVFSLCINDTATRDDISCPDGMVCTGDDFVCYPEPEAVASCPRTYHVPEDHINSCGECNGPDKVFSCISERKIAFCFGHDEPNYENTAICPEGSVCDLRNEIEFCTNATEIEPSCIIAEESTGQTTIRQADPTDDMIGSTEMTTMITETPIITMTTTIIGPTTSKPTTAFTTSVETTKIETKTKPTTTASTTTVPTTTKSTTTVSTATESTSTVATTIKSTTTVPTTTAPVTTVPTTTKSTTTESTTIVPTTTKPTTTESTTIVPITTKLPTIKTSIKPTTTTTSTTTTEGITTLGLPRDPNTICRDMGEPGSYPLDNDTACTKFVMCYRSSDKLRGLSLNCEKDMYFNTELSICMSEKPANCV